MRIVVISEAFVPSTDEVADTSRHVVEELLRIGHNVLVITSGTGVASWRGARIVRSRRLLPDGAVSCCVDGFEPEAVIAIAPRVLGNLTLRHAVRAGVPTLSIDPVPMGVRADRVLATSTAVRQPLDDSGIDCEIWRPGVCTDEHHPRLRDERMRAAWAKGNRLVVGHVGPVTKEKVIGRLERIAALDDVRLVVIGDGPGTRRLRGAGAKVTTAMSSLETARAIASLDVLVAPRKKDTAVPGVRRALASGVPVVGFATGGTPDVVTDEVNGLLVAADRNGLRSGVRRLRDDSDLLAVLSSRARESVTGRNWADAVADLAQHLPEMSDSTARQIGSKKHALIELGA